MLPRLCHDLEAIQATGVRRDPRDCQISELLRQEPDGSGPYLWVQVQHGLITSKQVAAALARSVDVDPRFVVHAGSRDRQSQVLQWFSLPADHVEHPAALRNAGYKKLLKVLDVQQAREPLQTSSVKALQYQIRLPGAAVDGGFLKARAILDRLRSQGCPNYIGYVRMGPRGQHAKWGKLLWNGRHLPRRVAHQQFDKKQYAQAWQGQIFNRYVAYRIDTGHYNDCLQGDVVQTDLQKPWSDRGQISADDPEQVQKRLDSWEAVVCGPMPGVDLSPVHDAALAFEAAFYQDNGIKEQGAFELPGRRRPIKFQPAQVSCDDQRDDLVLQVTADPQVYISNLLEELLQPERHII